MQACSSSETLYMLIFLIGMLIIPDIHIANDLLLHFIHVFLQISSLQKGLFLVTESKMAPITHPLIFSPLFYLISLILTGV